MSILGGAIGAGLGAFGSIFGGLSASKAMKRYKQNLEQQRKKNQDWYDRRYNEDATQRADAQAIMSRTEDSIRNRNRRAAGTQAVMGALMRRWRQQKRPIMKLWPRRQPILPLTARLARMQSRVNICRQMRISISSSTILRNGKPVEFHKHLKEL
jgi:hypothetical protein